MQKTGIIVVSDGNRQRRLKRITVRTGHHHHSLITVERAVCWPPYTEGKVSGLSSFHSYMLFPPYVLNTTTVYEFNRSKSLTTLPLHEGIRAGTTLKEVNLLLFFSQLSHNREARLSL